MEQFRNRLVEFRSLNDIRRLIQEFAEQDLSEELPLPFFVVRSVLEGVHERLSGRPLDTATWDQVKEALSGPLETVVDAFRNGERGALIESLNALIRRWALTQRELTE